MGGTIQAGMPGHLETYKSQKEEKEVKVCVAVMASLPFVR